VSLANAKVRERLSAWRERAAQTGPAGLVWLAALAALLLLVASLADPRGLRRWHTLRQDARRQERANEVLRAQTAELQRTVRQLSSPPDPAALERAAREQLGFIKPDELLFKFE
jgi:cell division protein FtsB